MRVLVVGLDRTPFTGEQRGDFVNRLKQYSKHVEHIDCLVYTPRNNYEPIKIGRKIVLWPTNNLHPFFFPFIAAMEKLLT